MSNSSPKSVAELLLQRVAQGGDGDALLYPEGAAWKKWNNVMRQEIPKNQTKEGKEAGSWDPTGDRWASYGGRLYETCLCIYMLEVYYRHLPIYKWRGK